MMTAATGMAIARTVAKTPQPAIAKHIIAIVVAIRQARRAAQIKQKSGRLDKPGFAGLNVVESPVTKMLLMSLAIRGSFV